MRIESLVLQLLLVGACVAQDIVRPPGTPRGTEYFAGSDDAKRLLEQQGFVVVTNGVVAETGRPLRQLFDVYLDSMAPQVVTADVVADAFCALLARATVEVDHAMALSLGAYVDAIETHAKRAGDAQRVLLGSAAKACRALLADPTVARRPLLERSGLGGTVDPFLLDLVAESRAYRENPELRGCFAARRLLQLVSGGADLGDALRAARQPLIEPLAGLFGPPPADVECGAAPIANDALLLPWFESVLVTAWRRGERLPGAGAAGASPPVPSTALLAWLAAPPEAATAGAPDRGIAGMFVASLRRLHRPADGAAPVFASKAWASLHANTQLAALVLTHDAGAQHFSARYRCIPEEPLDTLVVPFPGFFADVAKCSDALGALAAAKCSATVRVKERAELLEDVAQFALTCTRLGTIAGKQVGEEPLGDDEKACLKTLGLTLGRMHGYRHDAAMTPRDDHARSMLVGIDEGGRHERVGLARPEILYVLVRRGGELVLHRGAVMSYREAVTAGDAPATPPDAWPETTVPARFRAWRR
jgi:hypothetical protein